MKSRAFWFVGVICAAVFSAKADDIAFQYTRDVELPKLEQDELIAIRLDTKLFAATRDAFPDVRLLDGDGKHVPFVIRTAQASIPRKVRTTWTANPLSAMPLDDGGLEITLELKKDSPHPNGVTLITPLKNFRQRVRVFTSADGMTWELVGEEAVIFDYSRYVDVRTDSVAFPETEQRHLRIVIDDVTVEQESELMTLTRRLSGEDELGRTETVTVDRRPFRIERIEFWRETDQARVIGTEKKDYPVTGFELTNDTEKQQTILLVETERQPLTSLSIETTAKNFSRHAVVEVENLQGVNRTWRKTGEGTLSRIDFKTLQREELSVEFPESRQPKYRVVIENRDNEPLDITGVKAEGVAYEVVFLASPHMSYHLDYSSADAEPATYDTAAIQESLRKGFNPTQAKLGEQKKSATANIPAAFRWSTLLNNVWLLGGAILAMVLLLGWGLFHAAKRMDELPTDES